MHLFRFIALIVADFLGYAAWKLREQRGSISFDQATARAFHATLSTLYQQEKSLLENQLTSVHRGVKGEKDSFDRLGPVIATDIADRHGDTQYLNPKHSKRWDILVPSEAAVLLDKEDEIRALINPTSEYTKTIAAALGRRADKHVINAAVGVALEGQIDQTGGLTSVSLPAGQQIALGSSPNDVFTLAKVQQASAILSKAGVPNNPKSRIMLYSPGQEQALLNITQAASSDFTKNKLYDTGSMNGLSWMGFTWIEIPDVKDESGATLSTMLPIVSTTRTCIALATDAVGLSIGLDVQSFMDVLPHKHHALQVRAEIMMAAVRKWDTGVVSIATLEQ
ncbi:MAG TPA: phage capsid protein [Candidatus Binatia bacterium]|jgi:hypothetical protein